MSYCLKRFMSSVLFDLYEAMLLPRQKEVLALNCMRTCRSWRSRASRSAAGM